MRPGKRLSHHQVHQFLDEVLGADLHAKRVASLADATLALQLHFLFEMGASSGGLMGPSPE